MMYRVLFVVICCLGLAVSTQAQESGIRFVNLLSNSAAVDAYLEDVAVAENLAGFSASLLRSEFPTGVPYSIDFRPAGTDGPPMASLETMIDAGRYHSVCLMGTPSDARTLGISWNTQDKPSGEIVKLRVVQASAERSGAIAVLFAGNLFFQGIAQYSASDFANIIRVDTEKITIQDAGTGAVLGSFSGSFEPGNVYTIFVTDGQDGIELHVLLESAVDEQSPMEQPALIGDRILVRGVHLTSDAPGLNWKFNGNTEFIGNTYGSATEALRIISDGETQVELTQNQGSNVVVADSIFSADPALQYTIVAHNRLSRIELNLLEWDREVPEAEMARMRVVNLYTAIASMDLLDASGGAMFEKVAAGEPSGFRDVEAGAMQLRAVEAGTSTVFASGELSLNGGGVYTVFVNDIGGQPEMRLLEESGAAAQEPMPLLQAVQFGETGLRAVNFLREPEVGLAVTLDEADIDTRLEYASATSIIRDNAPGAHMVAVADADAPETSIIQSQVELVDTEYTLYIAFGGNPQSAQGVAFNSPLKPLVNRDSVLVRVVNAAENVPSLSVFPAGSEKALARNLAPGDISEYRRFSKDERNFSLRDDKGREFATVLDNTDGARALTLILGYNESNNVQMYGLPDDVEDEMKPLERLETNLVTDVDDGKTAQSLRIQPNPARHTAAVLLHLEQAGQLAVSVYSLSGIEVLSLAPGYLVPGRHSFELPLQRLAGGTYWVYVQAGSFTSTRKLHIVR